MENLVKELDKDINETLNETILSIRMTCNVPSNLSDDDLKKIFEPYLKDGLSEQFDNSDDFITHMILNVLQDLVKMGITFKTNVFNNERK